jgi:endonuclease/exonuclease/phosphatase family metal-dependent hydrolase
MLLRVMTYNVLDGGGSREDLIVEVLREVSADVVVLQEVFDGAFVERIGDALGMQHFVARGNSKYHLAILSRWPIGAHHSYHPFPPIQQTVLEATIDCPNGQSLVVFGVHPVARPLVFLELWRLWELRVVLRRIERRGASACLLLCGFNANVLHPDIDGFTYGPAAPVGRIDYVFASAALTPCLTKCFVAREPAAVDRASDHYPVVAEFAL